MDEITVFAPGIRPINIPKPVPRPIAFKVGTHSSLSGNKPWIFAGVLISIRFSKDDKISATP